MKATLMLAAVALMLLNGCATILNGTNDNVQVNSEPSNAKVYVNGYAVATTPAKLKLESDKVHNIEVKKDGYETWHYSITHGVGAGWVVLDIFLGIIPVIVDAITGAWHSLDTSSINAVLEESP
ncbi:MAG: PEGA domain-containing protein [candidate division Zixibacteria bacterium]|nr:PEGA domain-containing protein [candidate division Zixibacteria bacterium]MBU1470167.1 PEGA domain-containing protein [candidate division Zixibacteria bacterium]